MSKVKVDDLLKEIRENVVDIKNVTELNKHLKPLYIIDDYIHPVVDNDGNVIMTAKENYNIFKETIYSIIKGCFEKKDCFNTKVRFKFYKTDKKVHELILPHFVSNIFLWYAFTNLYNIDNAMNESFIFKCDTNEDAIKINDFLDNTILACLNKYSVSKVKSNQTIADIYYDLKRISNDFADIMNIQFGIETFLYLYNNVPGLKELMATSFSPDTQPAEIESIMNELEPKVINLVMQYDTAIALALRANSIKKKQFMEFLISEGLKPDINGVTIPININNSNLTGGANTADAHYIDASGARKSLIQNKEVMGKAGYFGKIVTELGLTLTLSKDITDCKSKHLLEITITSKAMLRKFNGRYYKNSLDEKYLKCLNSSKDKYLIGKTLYFRSPITCACTNDEVCPICFGRTSILNRDISNGVTGFEVEEWTKVVNQMILSTKHLLTTMSESIKFNDTFDKFFTLIGGEISLKENINDDPSINLNDYVLYLPDSELHKSEELDDDSQFNTYINTKFNLVKLSTGEMIEIYSFEERELYLSNECLELRAKNKGYIKLSDIDNSISLFIITILNNELTKPLYSIMELINTNKKLEEDEEITYHKVAQRFVQLLVDSNIDAMSVAGELIINRMIRNDPDLTFYRPDFTGLKVPKYKIVTVNYALEHNRSPILGQLFSYIKRQCLSDEITTIKDGASYADILFMKEIDFSYLEEVHKMLRENKNLDF